MQTSANSPLDALPVRRPPDVSFDAAVIQHLEHGALGESQAAFGGLDLGDDDPGGAEQHQVGPTRLGTAAIVGVVHVPPVQLRQLDNRPLESRFGFVPWLHHPPP